MAAEDPRLRVLLVAADEARARLRALLPPTRWDVVEAASIEQVLQAEDERPECAPNTLYPNGVEPRTGRGESERTAAITSAWYPPDVRA